ncbi:hypothetical protein KR059_000604 [Drosophila kikkawai]|nr:hypothetical protein KR059_000604 [Drosophila kikkawai]
MFEPETEDMLPRSAPRPSAAVPMGHSNEVIRPTVPEVSILFGQPPQQQQEPMMQMQMQPAQEQSPRPEPTFASWKKQMLPRVNFSPILTTELGPRPAPSSSNNHNLGISSNEYIVIPRDRHYTNEAGSCATSSGGMYSESKKQQFQSVRRLSTPSSSDVLTICAGTQTDVVNRSSPRTSLPSVVYSDIDVSNLVNKNDLATVVSLLETMRQEQQQLRRLCETLLEQHQARAEAAPKPSRTTASQCDILTSTNNNNHGKRLTPIIQDYIVEEEEEPPARVVPQQFQSPRPTQPMAQSTGYRANTPQGPAKRIPQLAKPNTEKSMVMNELALKYLRQPVDELMKDMRLGSSPKSPNHAEPLRQIDNLGHTPGQSSSPNDISNASYKYLKKYRLLPEEQLDYARSPQSPLAAPPQMQLDLENIRNQPKLM